MDTIVTGIITVVQTALSLDDDQVTRGPEALATIQTGKLPHLLVYSPGFSTSIQDHRQEQRKLTVTLAYIARDTTQATVLGIVGDIEDAIRGGQTLDGSLTGAHDFAYVDAAQLFEDPDDRFTVAVIGITAVYYKR